MRYRLDKQDNQTNQQTNQCDRKHYFSDFFGGGKDRKHNLYDFVGGGMDNNNVRGFWCENDNPDLGGSLYYIWGLQLVIIAVPIYNILSHVTSRW